MNVEVLKRVLKEAQRDERHNTVAETRYWCSQYKAIAERALAVPVQEPVAWIRWEMGSDGKLKQIELPLTTPPAQPAPTMQEPVAWMHEWDDGERIPMLRKRDVDSSDIDSPKSVRPLVFGDTTPPAAQLAPAVNVRCETTNGSLQGVTYLNVIRVEREDDGSLTVVTDHWPTRTPPAAQRQWVGLTDYEIGVCSTEAAMNRSEMVGGAVTFARAIEAKLKEKNCE